jgi:hypothetical protein
MTAQPDDLIVTTATMSADEIRESLGEPKEAPKPDVTPEEEADDASKPDSALSEAGRTLRNSRGDARKAKLHAEIEDLARKRLNARLDFEREELERKQLRESQPPAKPAASTPTPTPTVARAAGPTESFKFPDFDAWQANGHTEQTYEDYGDARADARYEWNRQREFHEQQQRENARIDAERKTAWEKAHATFRADHADFDAVLEATVVPVTPATQPQPDGSPSPLYQLIRSSGEKAPQILYYLGKHPEEVQVLAQAPNPPALLYAFAQMEMRATGSITPPAARPTPVTPPAPTTPVSAAAPPLTPISGGTQHARSLQSLAEDEDADAYIRARRAELRRTG